MDDSYLSPGGVVALVSLSNKPQDVEITVQIKEQLSFKDHYAVSDGVHWVPVFLGGRVWPVETGDLMQITRACYYRNLGFVYVGCATVAHDQSPAYIIGNPMELALEFPRDFRRRFPIALLNTPRPSWSEDEDLRHPPIRALVTYKSKLEGGNIQGGKPPFFMVHLLDETGEIRASATDGVAAELYNHFEEGKVYYVHNTSVRNDRNLSFYNLAHRSNLSLTRETVVEECHEIMDIPILRFDFMQLDQFYQAEMMTICGTLDIVSLVPDSTDVNSDVVGVVSYVGPLEGYITQKNQEIFRRGIMIADQTQNNVPAILWANRAEEFNVPTGTVVAFRNVKVMTDDQAQVRYLSVLSPSTIHIEPQMEEAVFLRRWFAQLDFENIRGEFPK